MHGGPTTPTHRRQPRPGPRRRRRARARRCRRPRVRGRRLGRAGRAPRTGRALRGAGVPARRGRARRDAAGHRRLRGARAAPGRPGPRAGAVPHRPGRPRGPARRTHRRRRRLPDEALRHRRAARPCPHPGPDRTAGGRGTGVVRGRGRRPPARRGGPLGAARRRADRAHADRVRAPPPPRPEREPGAVPRADPGERVGHGLRHVVEPRRHVRLVPAAEARRRTRADAADGPGRRYVLRPTP